MSCIYYIDEENTVINQSNQINQINAPGAVLHPGLRHESRVIVEGNGGNDFAVSVQKTAGAVEVNSLHGTDRLRKQQLDEMRKKHFRDLIFFFFFFFFLDLKVPSLR